MKLIGLMYLIITISVPSTCHSRILLTRCTQDYRLTIHYSSATMRQLWYGQALKQSFSQMRLKKLRTRYRFFSFENKLNLAVWGSTSNITIIIVNQCRHTVSAPKACVKIMILFIWCVIFHPLILSLHNLSFTGKKFKTWLCIFFYTKTCACLSTLQRRSTVI
jgi:hypothetical protein